MRLELCLVTCILLFQLIQAQPCVNEVGCDNCFPWCEEERFVRQICKSSSNKFCKKACNLCTSETDVCRELRCTQRCMLSEDGRSGHCECFDGFRLQEDRRTCQDIDECAEMPNVCGVNNSTTCINSLGSYACTACTGLPGLRSYYGSNACCKRNARSYLQCGFSSTNGRIAGGRSARAARWPWTAYVKAGLERCGGSLISRSWVLTAAHCVSQLPVREISVVLGAVNTSESGNVHIQTIAVTRVEVHQNYRFPINDLALLRLTRQAHIGRYVGTICLPNGQEPTVGQTCYATGYGTTSYRGEKSGNLQEVDLPIIENSLCRSAYENETLTVNPRLHMCAGYTEGGKDACQGDSGGPLVCQRCNNCDWYIAGITTFGKGCATPGFYGVYTRASEYEEWIARITRQELRRAACVRPAWHAWGGWTECSVTCGGGTRSRIRFCVNGKEGDPDCIGTKNEIEPCNTQACQECMWSSWVDGSCSVSCGTGTRIKRRRALNGNIGDSGCESGGESKEEACDEQECPMWTEWSSWTECSVSCGQGSKTSERICLNGLPGLGCKGDVTRMTPCFSGVCGPGPWTPCSSSCGGGIRFRTRGDEIEEESCNPESCPEWGPFGEWGECNVTCGGGMRERRRECLNGDEGDIGCDEGVAVENEVCNDHTCPVWSHWSDWGICSTSCGGGRRSAFRTCNTYGREEAECDGKDTKTEECQTDVCPRWEMWGHWGECSVSCGVGIQTRSRECIGGNPGDHGCHGSRTMSQACGEPVPSWGPPIKIGTCSKSCGSGRRLDRRSCNVTQPGCGCIGDGNVVAPCNTHKCAKWTRYHNSPCSVTCGNGTITAVRQCLNGNVGDSGCRGSPNRVIPCHQLRCPGRWSEFGNYGACSRSCGGGTQERFRVCIGGESGSPDCIGNLTEVRSCNNSTCPPPPTAPANRPGPATCSRCIGKVNKLDIRQCARFIGMRYCLTYAPFMEMNCDLACCESSYCPPVPVCDDHDTRCPLHITSCPSNLQVLLACPRTCGYCSR